MCQTSNDGKSFFFFTFFFCSVHTIFPFHNKCLCDGSFKRVLHWCVHVFFFLTDTCFKLVFETNKVCMRQLIILRAPLFFFPLITLVFHSQSRQVDMELLLRPSLRSKGNLLFDWIKEYFKTTISKNILCFTSIRKIDHGNILCREHVYPLPTYQPTKWDWICVWRTQASKYI